MLASAWASEVLYLTMIVFMSSPLFHLTAISVQLQRLTGPKGCPAADDFPTRHGAAA
jgi:hypothetical protein